MIKFLNKYIYIKRGWFIVFIILTASFGVFVGGQFPDEISYIKSLIYDRYVDTMFTGEENKKMVGTVVEEAASWILEFWWNLIKIIFWAISITILVILEIFRQIIERIIYFVSGFFIVVDLDRFKYLFIYSIFEFLILTSLVYFFFFIKVFFGLFILKLCNLLILFFISKIINIYIINFYLILFFIVILKNIYIVKFYLFIYLVLKVYFYLIGFLFLFSIFGPLFIFLLLLIFGMYIGIYGVLSMIILTYILIICLIIFISINLIKNMGFFFFYREYVDFFDLCWNWNFICDSLTITMCFVIILISFLVHLYSFNYMRYDPHLIRFLSLLSLFTFFMLFLVSSGNILQIFIGWEGVGLCSYLLINFWFTRIKANKAAIKAMLINRIGDISLMLFIILFFYVYRTFDFSIIYLLELNYQYAYLIFGFVYIHLYSLFSLFLLIAAVGKSAQLGLHTWLPDAMEGPTPVSALIHAATMVTAGVFLLIRFNFFLDLSLIKEYVYFFGCFTALFGSCIALIQNDIKKVIAYSTCSQLGYMFVARALSRYDVALFHLINHAFFKALLFLSAGIIIHNFLNEQDMRKMGGLAIFFVFTYLSIFIASYALIGLPYLSGFYSKDLIIELSFFSFTFSSFFAFLLLLLSAFFTACYSIRLLYLVFLNIPNGFFESYFRIKENSFIVFSIFSWLINLTLFFGYFFFDLFVGSGSSFFFNIIDIKPYIYNIYIDFEFIKFFYKMLPLVFSVFGLIFGYYLAINFKLLFMSKFFFKLNIFFNYKWYFDYIYNVFISNFFLNVGYKYTYKQIDKNLLELFGSKGVYYFLIKMAFLMKKIYNSYVYMYVNMLIIAIIIILIVFNSVDFFENLQLIIFIIIYFYSFYIFNKSLYISYYRYIISYFIIFFFSNENFKNIKILNSKLCYYILLTLFLIMLIIILVFNLCLTVSVVLYYKGFNLFEIILFLQYSFIPYLYKQIIFYGVIFGLFIKTMFLKLYYFIIVKILFLMKIFYIYVYRAKLFLVIVILTYKFLCIIYYILCIICKFFFICFVYLHLVIWHICVPILDKIMAFIIRTIGNMLCFYWEILLDYLYDHELVFKYLLKGIIILIWLIKILYYFVYFTCDILLRIPLGFYYIYIDIIGPKVVVPSYNYLINFINMHFVLCVCIASSIIVIIIGFVFWRYVKYKIKIKKEKEICFLDFLYYVYTVLKKYSKDKIKKWIE